MIERRPWGWMIRLIATKWFWIKVIRVKKDQRTSLQYHNNRAEIHLCPTRLPQLVWFEEDHRMECGLYLEFAFGSEVSEDDIVRLADDYHRVSQ